MSGTAARSVAAIGATAHFDHRLAGYDVAVSSAHVRMLRDQGIVDDSVAVVLLRGLSDLQAAGASVLDPESEDVHTAVEESLARTIGTEAGWLGVARARNDLAVTALRLYVRDEQKRIEDKLVELVGVLVEQARVHAETVMPGLSHLQVAQPVTFGFVCAAYATALERDLRRFRQLDELHDECPMGAAALAGTSFPIDRAATARDLGFAGPSTNALETVADRSFALDFLAAGASLALDLSRFSAEVIFWSSQLVGLVGLPDDLVSTSSALPHKRNPDAAELIRAKSGRVVGNLHALQAVLKGLPLSYFRDLQEDKEPVFDTVDTLHLCLDAAISIAREMQPQVEAMRTRADLAHVTSSDYAEWLTMQHGIPFRESHHLVAGLVRAAEDRGCGLGDLTSGERALVDPRLTDLEWPRICVDRSVASRTSAGGTAPERVREASEEIRARVAIDRREHGEGGRA